MTTPKRDPEFSPRKYEYESFNTLKSWVHWVLRNPIDEDQEALAKSINDLFALLGTRDHQLSKAESIAQRRVEEARMEGWNAALEECEELLQLARSDEIDQDWRSLIHRIGGMKQSRASQAASEKEIK